MAAVYGTVEAPQLIWPDSTGRFPWQEGRLDDPSTQPLLGPLAAAWSVDPPWLG